MRGPGAETRLLMPQELAVTLADGMEAGGILIPSDDVAFDIIRRWAESPDAFIRAKIDEFASGDRGNPEVPEAILKMVAPSS